MLRSPRRDGARVHSLSLMRCGGLANLVGRDVRDLPLVERKARLANAILRVPGIQLIGHLEAHGEALFGQVVELGLDRTTPAGKRCSFVRIDAVLISRSAYVRGALS
jgi:hypothetical protein